MRTVRLRTPYLAFGLALICATGVILASAHANARGESADVSCVTLDPKYNREDLPACFVPYLASSPWNQLLPEKPRLVANSQAIMDFLWSAPFDAGMNSARISRAQTSDDYGFPYYFASASDPLVVLHCTEHWGRCAIEGMRMHIPAFARHASGCCDHHLTIIDVATADEYDLYEAQDDPPQAGAVFTVGWGGKSNVRSGTGWGPGSGGTAAGAAQFGGIVRISELAAGAIRHALAMTTACTLVDPVFPATAHALQPCKNGVNGPTAPLGARIWLDMGEAQIASLPISSEAKTVLVALHTYGGFITDTNGNDTSMAINSLPESPTQFVAAAGSDVVGTYFAEHVPWRPFHPGQFQLDLWHAIDWRAHLHVVDTCVTRHSC
jgi:hypothetical protein